MFWIIFLSTWCSFKLFKNQRSMCEHLGLLELLKTMKLSYECVWVLLWDYIMFSMLRKKLDLIQEILFKKLNILPPKWNLVVELIILRSPLSLYSLIWDFLAFWDSHKYKNMDKITQWLENVVRCNYFEAGVHIKNPIKNSYQDGLGRTTQTFRPCCCGPYINLRQEKVSN